MRQQPDLSDDKLIAGLHTHYNLPIVSCRYLPIGYDLNAFVYEALTEEGVSYFVKVRDGAISLPSLLVPCTLIEHGISNILAPLRTNTQALWYPLDRYSVTVYPFIRGENAMVGGLSDRQWREFGATLRAIHSGGFGTLLQGQVKAETFSLPSAQLLQSLLAWIKNASFQSQEATHLALFCNDNERLIKHLLSRAKALGQQLQRQSFEHVLCHADIHAANILVSEAGRIYLVDWDGPLLAPKERDLLFVIGSKIARSVEPHEEALFFQGYGSAEINLTALAYYRYERVIEDIGEMGRSVFWKDDLSELAKSAEATLLRRQFVPGSMVESAIQADTNQGGPSF